MKKLLISFLLAVLPLSSFAASGTAIPGGSQSTPFIINKPGAYYLAANRVMTVGSYGAIQIQAPDVTLDLNGYAVSFSEAFGGLNNCITSNGSNTEIRNGSLHTAGGDAVVSHGEGLRIIDVRIADTGGISSEGADALIERCHITDSHGNGIYLGGRGGVAKDCSIKNATGDLGYGIWLGSFTTVIGCSIGQTEASGIFCYGSSCVVKNNKVYEANLGKVFGRGGIVATDNCIISENVVARCYSAGISVHDVGCLVEKNVINRTQAASPAIGAAIVSDDNSTILRGNVGTRNAGPLTSGAFVDGGDNIGD